MELAELATAPGREREPFPFEDLVQLSGVNLELVMIINVKGAWHLRIDLSVAQFSEEQLRGGEVFEMLFVFEAASQQQRMCVRRPFMMPTPNNNRVLVLIKPEMWPGVSWVIVLEIIPRIVVFVFDQGQDAVLRGDLLFYGGVPFN